MPRIPGGRFLRRLTVADLGRGPIYRKPVLGSLINEYSRAAYFRAGQVLAALARLLPRGHLRQLRPDHLTANLRPGKRHRRQGARHLPGERTQS
jgi:hypothetical protein